MRGVIHFEVALHPPHLSSCSTEGVLSKTTLYLTMIIQPHLDYLVT